MALNLDSVKAMRRLVGNITQIVLVDGEEMKVLEEPEALLHSARDSERPWFIPPWFEAGSRYRERGQENRYKRRA